jgi:hypothetical protein
MINAFKQIRLSNGVLISGSEGRISVANSGSLAFASEVTDLKNSVVEISGLVDNVAVEVEVAANNISSLTTSNNYLVSGLSVINDTLSIQSGEIIQLKTGVNASLEVLVSHQERLSGIDSALLYLSSGISLSNKQVFSSSIPSGVEELTIMFPSGSFESIPAINATLESEVGYMFSLKNKTVSGFDVGFSDVIQEDNVFLDVTATIKT